MKKKVLGLLTALAAALFSHGAAGARVSLNPEAKPMKVMTYALSSGSTVRACERTAEGAELACADVKMPKQVGEVKRIVTGDFIRPVQGAWLALADTKSSLCVLLPDQRDSRCVVLDSAPMTSINISFQQTKGVGMLVFDPADVRAESRPSMIAKIEKFDAALTKAFGKLQKHVTARLINQSALKVGSDLPSPHECGVKEDVVIICAPEHEQPDEPPPDNPIDPAGPGPAGPGEPGEGPGPGQPDPLTNPTKCIPGPIVVCITPPPPPLAEPTLPPPSPPWTFCSLLGLFCDAPPTLPPALPPMGRTYEEDAMACDAGYDTDMDECQAYRKAVGEHTYRACTQRAADYYAQCLSDARARHGH